MKKHIAIFFLLFAAAFTSAADMGIQPLPSVPTKGHVNNPNPGNNTNIGVNSNAGAWSNVNSTGGNVSINTKANPAIFFPGGHPSVQVGVATFFNNGMGLAEKNMIYMRLFSELSNGSIPLSAYTSDRAKTITTLDLTAWYKPDFSKVSEVVFTPLPDYLRNVPSERETIATLSPTVTDITQFASMPENTSYYIIGYVAMITKPGYPLQDLIMQQALFNEGMRFLAAIKPTGFANVTPVAMYDTAAYYQGTRGNTTGETLSPSAALIPAYNLGVGGMGSLQNSDATATPTYGTAMVIYLFAKAPNPTQGHLIVPRIRQIQADYEASLKPQEPPVVPAPVVVEKKVVVVKKVCPTKSKYVTICKKVKRSALKK